MTDNEIIKALEDVLKNFDGKVVHFMAISSALDLINRQQAEIDRLKNRVSDVCDSNRRLINSIEQDKSEAIKEFAKRLKEKYKYHELCGYKVINGELDDLVKEMVGEE